LSPSAREAFASGGKLREGPDFLVIPPYKGLYHDAAEKVKKVEPWQNLQVIGGALEG
jgi:hypothetical protein